MTVAGEITGDDRQWAVSFIKLHFRDIYFDVLRGEIPREMPDLRSQFHIAWTGDLSASGYDKAQWLRREIALCQELRAAFARFLDRSPADDDLADIVLLIKEYRDKSG